MKWTVIVAMLCIAGLEALALIKGINGAIFGVAITALAGLGGYEIKVLIDKRKEGK